MDAALIANSYNSIRNTTNVVAAQQDIYLEKTLSKIWDALDFLNEHTDKGFFKPRQVKNDQLLKRASIYTIIDGQQVETGWKSQIQGIKADKPNKIRGDRTDLLFYEEGGCHAAGTKVIMADGRLKNVEDVIVGDKLMGDDGTPRTVIELHNGVDLMYKIIPKNGMELIVNSNHIIYGKKYSTNESFEIKAKDFYDLSKKLSCNDYRLIKYNYISKDTTTSTFKIEPYEEGEYYGFSLDGNQLFLLEDFTICHNSWPNSTKAFIQGDALVGVQGSRFGIKIIGGTGGDTGPALEGLRLIYSNPDVYDVLPFRHCYTTTGDEALTGFFIPAYNVVNLPGYIDKRGYTDPIKGREFYDSEREKKTIDPKALSIYCAEYCYTAEEAFSLEGDNKFNKELIAELLSRIRILKECPEIDTGTFSFQYVNQNIHKVENRNIKGVVWKSNKNNNKIKILEHPLWTLPPEKDPDTGEPIARPTSPVRDLYVAGVDGIDIGKSLTSTATKNPSDFCMVIKKRAYGLQPPQVVAIYKDRPENIHEAYENAISLALYYNARINIEATRVSFLTWARGANFLHWFMKRPRATYSDITKRKSTAYGTPATDIIINHLTDLIRDFVQQFYYTIWFEEMLDLLNQYNDENKGKFDIIAALAMAELADEELQGSVPKIILKEEEIIEDIGYYYDSNGVKRWGIIPKSRTPKIQYNYDYDEYEDDYNRPRTSDPRVYNYALSDYSDW